MYEIAYLLDSKIISPAYPVSDVDPFIFSLIYLLSSDSIDSISRIRESATSTALRSARRREIREQGAHIGTKNY